MKNIRPDRVGCVNVNLNNHVAFYKMYATMNPIVATNGTAEALLEKRKSGNDAGDRSASQMSSNSSNSFGSNLALHVGGITYVGATTSSLVHVVDLDLLERHAESNDAEATMNAEVEGALIPIDVSASGFPDDLAQHTAVTTDNGRYVYIFGNYCSRNWDIFRFDADTLTMQKVFTNGDPLPENFHCHSSVLVEEHTLGPVIYSFGGACYKESIDKLYAFELLTNVWREIKPKGHGASMIHPPKRLYHLSAAVGKIVYIFGGAPDVKSTTADDPVYNDMWKYDTEADVWSPVQQNGQVPTPRGSAIMHYIAPYMYLVGGYDGTKALDDVYRFDPAIEHWVDVSERFGRAEDAAEEEGMTWMGFPTNTDTPEPGMNGTTSPGMGSPSTSQGLLFTDPAAEQHQWGADTDQDMEMIKETSHCHDLQADQINATKEKKGRDSRANPNFVQSDALGGRWATASCVMHKSKIFVAGGFSAKKENPTEMDLCERLDCIQICPLSVKHMLARYVVSTGILQAQTELKKAKVKSSASLFTQNVAERASPPLPADTIVRSDGVASSSGNPI